MTTKKLDQPETFESMEAYKLFTEKYWQNYYPEGVVKEIESLEYKNLHEYISGSVDKTINDKGSNLTAFISAGCSMTYERFEETAKQLAGCFAACGIKKGDVIALMMPNLLQFPVAFYAALKVNATITCVNPLYTPSEMKHQLSLSEAKLIVCFESFAANLEQIIDKTLVKHVVLTNVGDILNEGLNVKGNLINQVLKFKGMVPEYNKQKLKKVFYFKQALSEGRKFLQNKDLPKISSQLNDIALLQFTGGTTGVSKGAQLSHFNVLSNLAQAMAVIDPVLKEENQAGQHTILTMLPLYHIYALSINCLAFLALGARNILIANPRDMNRVMGVIKKEKITMLTAVNTLFNSMMEHELFDQMDWSQLKFTLSGGMALQEVIARRWYEKTKCAIVEGYGMSETSPILSVPPLKGQIPVFRGNVGQPVPGVEIRIRKENGLWADIGGLGEICARGPQVMVGYLKNEAETKNIINEEGWLATGDIGYMDEKGFLKIVDRKKDMLIVSGFNVYPNELEDVLARHPKIKEVGIVGEPDELTGEKVKACVVKLDASLTETEVIEYAKKYLTGYKVPKIVEFWEELPKTPVGKVLRKELRKKA